MANYACSSSRKLSANSGTETASQKLSITTGDEQSQSNVGATVVVLEGSQLRVKSCCWNRAASNMSVGLVLPPSNASSNSVSTVDTADSGDVGRE